MTSLDYRSVENALCGCRWSKTILTYESIGSTMDRAKELAHKRAPEGTLVVTAEQTEGRGRLDRSWLSPKGSLSLSLLLYPSLEKLPYLSMIAGLVAAGAIEKVSSLKASLKWPNDVLVDGKKAAGLLIESGIVQGRHFAVIGIGVNINLKMADYPEIAGIAASLSDESGGAVDAAALLGEIVEGIEKLYYDFDAAAILDAWKARLITLGQQVRATSGNSVVEGVAVDVTDEGALIIRQSDGALCTIVAGDVTLR